MHFVGFSKDFNLDTDAQGNDTGDVLSQKIEDRETFLFVLEVVNLLDLKGSIVLL